MTVSTLDSNSALIIVDLQKGILSFPTTRPIDSVVANAAALADAFRGRNRPVVLVTAIGVAPGRTEQARRAPLVFPDGFADLLPELKQQPSDLTVAKRTWGAFTGTGLEEQLKSRGVTQVVVTGVATSAGVESTARQAHEAGFHITLATDAMSDMNEDAHTNSVTRIFPRIGETGTTAEILALLEK